MSVTGTIIMPIKNPIVMIVDARLLSSIQSFTRRDNANKKNIPQIKASFDKNKSQRIRYFRPK